MERDLELCYYFESLLFYASWIDLVTNLHFNCRISKMFLNVFIFMGGLIEKQSIHTNKTHTPGLQLRSQWEKKDDWPSNQSERPLNDIIWVPQMASRGGVSLQSWPEAFEVSPSLSIWRRHQHSQWVSPIPSLPSLVHIQLHNCSCYVCYQDLSSPVRAALMHTTAHRPQSESLVLL